MPSQDQLDRAPLRTGPGPEVDEPSTAPEGDSSKRRRGSIARLASATYVGLALGFVTSPIVARVLGPEARGIYAGVYVFSTALVTILAFGMPVAIIYRLVKGLDRPEMLMGSAFRFCAALVLPAAAIAVTVTVWALDVPAGAATYLAVAALALAPIGVLGLCLQGFLLAEGELGPLSVLRVAPLLANFAGVMVLRRGRAA